MQEDLTTQGISALKSGNKEQARKFLTAAVTLNPSDEKAWLWLSGTVETSEKRIECLEKVLEINPDNKVAQKGLASLSAKKTESGTQTRAQTELLGEKKQAYQASSPKSNSVRQSVPPNKNRTKPKKNNNVIIVIGSLITISILLLAVIAILLFRLFNNRPSSLPELSPPTTNTPTTSIPTTTPISCQTATNNYLNEIAPLMQNFDDAILVANSTARIALGTAIQNLQSIRNDIKAISGPECIQESITLLYSGLDNHVNAYLDFMGNVDELTVQNKLIQGMVETTNAMEQMNAISLGKPTPIPVGMATLAPSTQQSMPTLAPRATPMPAGSSIIVGNWEIIVEKTEITQEIKFYDDIRKPDGRFAILFITVRNNGINPATFFARGHVQIQDAKGIIYEEDSVATFEASLQYSGDQGGEIQPGEIKYILAVFDISTQSDFYILVPGILEDQNSDRVYLSIP